LQRIVATTYEDNTASIRVMERLGMALVRRFRYAADETPGDTAVSDGDLWPGEDVLYAVDRSAWVGRGAG
jgi:RimJ/RimL family protein N-acetyltransferase